MVFFLVFLTLDGIWHFYAQFLLFHESNAEECILKCDMK